MPRILIIGYGNSLRGDDIIGVQAAEQLSRYFADYKSVTVVAAPHLMPEHAAMMAEADRVLLLDAAVGAVPGEITEATVTPEWTPHSPFTHSVQPPHMLGLTERLYGHTPDMTLLTLQAESFDHGEGLTNSLRDAFDTFLKRSIDLVDIWLGASPDSPS